MRKGGKCPSIYVDFAQNIIMKFAPREKKGRQPTEHIQNSDGKYVLS